MRVTLIHLNLIRQELPRRWSNTSLASKVAKHMSDFGTCLVNAQCHQVPIIIRPGDKDHIHLKKVLKGVCNQPCLGSSCSSLIHVLRKTTFHNSSKGSVPCMVPVAETPAAHNVVSVQLHAALAEIHKYFRSSRITSIHVSPMYTTFVSHK